MDLDDIKAKAAQLSMWAHMATVGADGNPDVVPVHPCWGPAHGDDDGRPNTLWVMCGLTSVKARNLAANPNVALHWQVTEKGDGLEVWGIGTVFGDVETKRRLWKGVFDYDLDMFSPGGPDNSPDTGFLCVQPQRALWVGAYGMTGTDRWHAE